MTAVILGIVLAIAFITDITKQRIPNALNIAGMVRGYRISRLAGGWSGLAFALTGLVCGFLPMLILYLLRAVGAGDVKLFGALGAVAGAVFTLYAMFLSALFAGILALFVLLWRSDRRNRLQQLGWSLVRSLMFKELAAWRTMTAREGALRIPFMWAVLPAFVYAYAAPPLLGI
ncbi:A24 family peptidase [Paenibacillus sp. P26]|nr:A24 family peptidase [Paenibacillus sp. P26]